MFKKKHLFTGIALSVLTLTSAAQAETLRDALIKAYLNNPTLNAERASLRASDEDVSQALANWRPNVTWTATVNKAINENNARTVGGERQSLSPTTSTLQITQPLFRGFRTTAAVAEAEETVQAERYRLLEEEQRVLLTAVTAFSDIVRDAAVLELNRNNEQVLRRQFEATTDRFEVGELTRTDVSQAEARFARATADRIQAEGDLEVSRANYENIIGEEPVNLVPSALPSDIPSTIEDSIEHAKKNNPTFLAAFHDEQSALENIKETSGQLLPELNLVASSENTYETATEGTRTKDNRVGLSLTVPLYQQGTVYSQVREAKQTAAQLRLIMEQSRRDAVEDAKSGWETLVTARARIQSFLAQIRSAEVALDGVQREAAVGSRTVLDVLDAEQELLDAKVNLVRAQRDELVAVFELKQALGDLTAEKLRLDTAVYDPTVHYDEVRDAWIGTTSVGDVDELKEVDKN